MVFWSLVVALDGGVVSSPVPLCERRPWWPEFVGVVAGVVSYNKAASVLVSAGLVISPFPLLTMVVERMRWRLSLTGG